MTRTPAAHRARSCHPRSNVGQQEPQCTPDSDRLVLEYLSLVRGIAWQIYTGLPSRAQLEWNDVMQAGSLGLISASFSYKGGTSVPFASYARHRIRGEILDSLRKLDPASRNLRTWKRRIEAAAFGLTETLQREPTDDEISCVLDITPAKFRRIRLDVHRSSSVTPIDQSDRDARWAATREKRPDALQEKTQLSRTLVSMIHSLPLRQKTVIVAYYVENQTMKEIGCRLRVNESRVSQIHKTALAGLARELTASGIKSSNDIFG